MDTKVINSRPAKKSPTIWRRRKCDKCKTTFTTYESPTGDAVKIYDSEGGSSLFNLGKLTISISKAFAGNATDGDLYSLSLAKTVEITLLTQLRHPSTEDVEAITHQVLKRFDELVGLQYAAQHDILQSVRRRGRPSIMRAP